jgi:hypothetical protein
LQLIWPPRYFTVLCRTQLLWNELTRCALSVMCVSGVRNA